MSMGSTAAGHSGPHLDNSSSKADGQLLSNKGSRVSAGLPTRSQIRGKGEYPGAMAEVSSLGGE